MAEKTKTKTRLAVSMTAETASKVKAIQAAVKAATGFSPSASAVVAAAVAQYRPPAKGR